jgi:CheY-like chemotaxis protein
MPMTPRRCTIDGEDGATTSEADVTTDEQSWTGETESPRTTVRVLLYSDHAGTRAEVRGAVGAKVASDLPPVEWIEAATMPAALEAIEAGGLDLLVLDGEAGKAGGMSLARQVKDEIFDAPPVLLLIARAADAWLASWSEADEVVSQPLDPFAFADTMAGMLRKVVA